MYIESSNKTILQKSKEAKFYEYAGKNLKFANNIRYAISDDYFSSFQSSNNRDLFRLPGNIQKTNQSSSLRLQKFHQINGQPFTSKKHPVSSSCKSFRKPRTRNVNANNVSFNTAYGTSLNTMNRQYLNLLSREDFNKIIPGTTSTSPLLLSEYENTDSKSIHEIIDGLYCPCYKTREKACKIIISANIDLSEDVQDKLMDMSINDSNSSVKKTATKILKQEMSLARFQKFIVKLLKGDDEDKKKALNLLCREVINKELVDLFRTLFEDSNFIIRKLCCTVCSDNVDMIEGFFEEIGRLCKYDTFESVRLEALKTIVKCREKRKLFAFISKMIILEEDDFLKHILEYIDVKIEANSQIEQSLLIRQNLGSGDIRRKIGTILKH